MGIYNDEIKNALDIIDTALTKIAQKKKEPGPYFGEQIHVPYESVENTIAKLDSILTKFKNIKTCDECKEKCEECEFHQKRVELYRVYKIIKGDWGPEHK